MEKDRYISEELWTKEFEPIMRKDFTEKNIMVSPENHKKMVDYAKTLAKKPEDWFRHVWSSVSGDDGTTYLVNNTAPFGPFAWFFTKKPWGESADDLITVAFEDQKNVTEDV